MNSLMMFSNEKFGSIRIVEINNEPWFVGKDVTDMLGYSNNRDALIKHVDFEDKTDVTIYDGRQDRNQTVINESGLYSLILRSRLKSANEFKHWVTSEVLPSIRKTGGYGNKDDVKSIISGVAKEVINEIMPYLFSYLCKESNYKQIKKGAVKQGLPGIIESLDNETREYVDNIIASQVYTYRELAKLFNEKGIKIGRTAIYNYVNKESKWFIKRRYKKDV